MKTYFHAQGVEKLITRDNFANGCDVKPTSSISLSGLAFSAPTAERLLKAVGDGLGLAEPRYWSLSECGEYLQTNRLENDNGDAPTATETADFEAGRRDLWLADYCFKLEKRTVEKVDAKEFAGLLGD